MKKLILLILVFGFSSVFQLSVQAQSCTDESRSQAQADCPVLYVLDPPAPDPTCLANKAAAEAACASPEAPAETEEVDRGECTVGKDDVASFVETNNQNIANGESACGCIKVDGADGAAVFMNENQVPVKYCINLQEPIAGVDSVSGQNGIDLFSSYIKQIYLYGASIIGIICVLVIVVSGIQISMGGANSEFVNQGKERIMQAMLSLILLFGAALVLRTINPGFFTLNPPVVNSEGQTWQQELADAEADAANRDPAAPGTPPPVASAGGGGAGRVTPGTCPLVTEQGVRVHKDFVSYVRSLESIADGQGKSIVFTSGFRRNVSRSSGATRSSHMVGYAVDLNVGGCSWGSGCLSRGGEPDYVRQFVRSAKSAGMRWGGDFSNYYDPVHFDIQPSNWDAIRQNILNDC